MSLFKNALITVLLSAIAISGCDESVQLSNDRNASEEFHKIHSLFSCQEQDSYCMTEATTLQKQRVIMIEYRDGAFKSMTDIDNTIGHALINIKKTPETNYLLAVFHNENTRGFCNILLIKSGSSSIKTIDQECPANKKPVLILADITNIDPINIQITGDMVSLDLLRLF